MTETPSTRQQRLAALLRATSGTIRVADAMQVLGVKRQHASKLLAGWHKQGVIRRVAHGLYVPIQPSALGQTQVLEDPWVLVPELYTSGYIGGWSALEYWELTEQLFRSVCVLTHKRMSYGETSHQGINFFVKYIPEKHLFGTKTIWRGNTKIQVSDPCKTILDIVDDLHLGAGLQHTTDCLSEFIKIFDKQSDLDVLLDYAIQINNGALFKKLGYLTEMLEFKRSFVDECQKRLTSGYATLDKNAQNNRLVTRWSLWVPGEKTK
ncbi:MAG: type IV toxin-antitoxin system AbiEi family antitoxin domain-containing protein [Pseudomonadales bacterium]